MVLRAWRGYGSVADAEAYPNHLLQTVRPKLEQLDGFRGLYLLRHREADEIEYLVLTLWESMDAVRAFAGEQPETSSLPSNGLAYGITCCCRWSVSIAFPATRTWPARACKRRFSLAPRRGRGVSARFERADCPDDIRCLAQREEFRDQSGLIAATPLSATRRPGARLP